jgi:plastocyanin
VFSHLRKSTGHRADERRAVLARSGLGLGAGVLAMVVLSACGSSAAPSGGGTLAASSGSTATVASPSAASPSSAGSVSPQAEAMIHISGFRYTVPASVSPGATVSVMNMDGENHTVTADAGNAFDVKATAGTTVTFVTPKKPGSYPFHCTYHSNMHAVLVVK